MTVYGASRTSPEAFATPASVRSLTPVSGKRRKPLTKAVIGVCRCLLRAYAGEFALGSGWQPAILAEIHSVAFPRSAR
jgi:hypothetical protein